MHWEVIFKVQGGIFTSSQPILSPAENPKSGYRAHPVIQGRPRLWGSFTGRTQHRATALVGTMAGIRAVLEGGRGRGRTSSGETDDYRESKVIQPLLTLLPTMIMSTPTLLWLCPPGSQGLWFCSRPCYFCWPVGHTFDTHVLHQCQESVQEGKMNITL